MQKTKNVSSSTLVVYNKNNIPAQQLQNLQILTREYKNKSISVMCKIINNGFNENDICVFFDVQNYLHNIYGQYVSIDTLIKFYNKFFNYPNADEHLLSYKITDLIDVTLNNMDKYNNICINTIIINSIKIADKLSTNDIDMVIDYINGDNIYY